MKLWNAIHKNFQLLMRSKSSAFIVLLGPLLVVTIISLSFVDSGVSTFNVGVYVPDSSELANRFIDNLNNSDTNLVFFNQSESCVSGIKHGTVLVCIVFPEDFQLSDESSNEVLFFVDESRVNLAHRLIATFALNLDSESSEVQKELTARMLEIMARANTDIRSTVSTVVGIKAKAGTIDSETGNSKTQLSSLDTDVIDVDLSSAISKSGSLKSDFNALYSKSDSVLDEGYDVLEEASNVSSDFESKLDSLNGTLNSLNGTSLEFDVLSTELEVQQANVDALESKVSASANAKTTVLSSLNKLSDSLSKLQSDLDSVKVVQESLESELGSFKLSKADSIVNPITTSVETVNTSTSKITFSFPYLMMLIVMFVGLMLASTLVMMEKNSRAYFRSFTLPITDNFSILATFITSLIVLFVQMFIVFLVVEFGLGVSVFSSLPVLLVVLFISASLFIFLGIAIGSFFNTNESVTMSTIALGSVFLFLSNLVLPLETLSDFIQSIVGFNPYVLASESIRKATLFKLGLGSMSSDILLLVLYAVIICIISIGIKKASSSKYLLHLHNRFNAKIVEAKEDQYLKIGGVDLTIKNISDLLQCLKTLEDSEYDKLREKSIFYVWLRDVMNKKFLAMRVRRRSRKGAIRVLESYLRSRN